MPQAKALLLVKRSGRGYCFATYRKQSTPHCVQSYMQEASRIFGKGQTGGSNENDTMAAHKNANSCDGMAGSGSAPTQGTNVVNGLYLEHQGNGGQQQSRLL